jgi:hypothetical protein
MVKDERIPREPAARSERCGDVLERASAIRPSRKMEQRPERAVDQRRGMVECQIPHIAQAKVKIHARCFRPNPGLLEHRRRGVDPHDSAASGLGHRNRYPAVTYGQLDEVSICFLGETAIERNVGRHLGRPRVIPLGESLFPAHRVSMPDRRSTRSNCRSPIGGS